MLLRQNSVARQRFSQKFSSTHEAINAAATCRRDMLLQVLDYSRLNLGLYNDVFAHNFLLRSIGRLEILLSLDFFS